MKKIALYLGAACTTLAGCVLVPVGHPYYGGPRFVAAPAVVVAHPGVWVR